MATSTGKKEYTLKINGIKENIKDITTLEATLSKLDATLTKDRTTIIKAQDARKQSTKAISDEEKAAKLLESTKARIEKVNTLAAKAQIAANIQLREATREVTRSIQVNGLAEGSIRQMGMQLTDLREDYENLTAAQRADEDQGGLLLKQIQALDTEYKALRESTGNFRDSVGNYEKALSGLHELKQRFDLVARGSNGLATDLVGSNEVLNNFGETADSVASTTEQLAGVVALATTAQEAYVAITKEGIIENKAAAIIDAIRAIQLKAKTAAEVASTKGTVAATIAQGIFNIVAAANPYVLLALGLAAVGAALYAFASSTDKAAEKQTKLNGIQAAYLDLLEAEATKLKTASDLRVKDAQTNLDVLNASGAKLQDIRAAEDRLAQEREANNSRLHGFYLQEVIDLEKNKVKAEEFRKVLAKLNQAKASGDSKIKLDINLDGKIDKVKVEDAIAAVQSSIDNLDKQVKIGVDINTEKAELQAQAKVTAAARIKADKDLAKERAALELSAQRGAEDARLKLILNGYQQARKQTIADYRRQIEDLRLQLKNEKELTGTARKAINAEIKSLELLKNKDLKALLDERIKKELETTRAAEDSRTALILGEFDRRQADINIKADRAIADLKKRLQTEKDLTKKQQQAITEEIFNANEQRNADLNALTVEDLNKRTSLELAALDSTLAAATSKIETATVRGKTGLKLIDVDATRKNLAEVNQALEDYISGLSGFQNDLKAAHEATLAGLKEGSTEYKAELQKYADANQDITNKIKGSQKEQVDNTKTSTEAQIEYYKDLFEKISGFASVNAEVVGGITDTLNSGLKIQLDELNAQLDIVNQHYEDAQKLREDAVKNVQDLEAKLQDATGGTAIALKEQLADAMAARNESEREEKRLAKEKEKRELDIQKKEKQIKRNDLIGNIAQSIANTAQGVTKALSLVFPLNLVVAGIVGALGAVQVGIMTKQLTKLAKGGKIVGPSHAGGGVNIGSGYEAEGGEFVVNKKAYAQNADLINYINSTNKKVTGSDIAGVAPGESSQIVVIEAGQKSDDRIIDAINAIDLQPTVAVTDIMDATDKLVKVRDISGA